MAGDGPAVLEFAIAAGDSAASLGSHREAAFQYGRAMPYLELLDTDAQIELLGKRAYECQVADDHEHAIEAWDLQLVLLRAAGRDLEVADALMGLDESYYTIGDNSNGSAFVDEAFDLLDGTEPTRAARDGADPSRGPSAARVGERGIRPVAGARPGDGSGGRGRHRHLTGDRTTWGWPISCWVRGRPGGGGSSSLQFAVDTTSRTSPGGSTSTGLPPWYQFDFAEAHARMEEAERYTADHDLNGHLMCVLATEISWKLDLGRWDEAVEQAHDLLYVRNTGRASRIEPLMALGLLAARRGDRETAWGYLDEARDYIAKSQTLGYQGTVAIARGEAHLLEDDRRGRRGGGAPLVRGVGPALGRGDGSRPGHARVASRPHRCPAGRPAGT